MEFDRDLRARQEVRLLAQQAQLAFEGLQKLDQSGLDRITEALSRAGALHAAELARDARVKEMWLTHYSPSLIRPEEYMETVRGIFPQAYPGKDGKSAELNFEEE